MCSHTTRNKNTKKINLQLCGWCGVVSLYLFSNMSVEFPRQLKRTIKERQQIMSFVLRRYLPSVLETLLFKYCEPDDRLTTYLPYLHIRSSEVVISHPPLLECSPVCCVFQNLELQTPIFFSGIQKETGLPYPCLFFLNGANALLKRLLSQIDEEAAQKIPRAAQSANMCP